MHDIVALPAVVGDAVHLLQLVHGDNVGYTIWKVPHLEAPVSSPLVRGDRSRVTVDPNSSRFGLDPLQVLVTLESMDGRTPVQVHPAVGQLAPLCKCHVQQLVCVLGCLLSSLFVCFQIHVQLGLLFPAELRAFVCPVARRPAIKAVRLPLTIRLGGVSTRATRDRAHVIAAAPRGFSRPGLHLGLRSTAFLSSSSCAPASSSSAL